MTPGGEAAVETAVRNGHWEALVEVEKVVESDDLRHRWAGRETIMQVRVPASASATKVASLARSAGVGAAQLVKGS
jgi:hypothetical protein